LTDLSKEALFEIKQKFLRVVPHPKLISKQLNKLGVQEDEVRPISSSGDMIVFMRYYLDTLMPLKLGIANGKTSEEIGKKILDLLHLQRSLIHELSSCFPEVIMEIDDSQIKQSSPFDVYQYIKELQGLHIGQDEIKQYLCEQFKKNDPSEFSEFAKGVLRARKIEGNG
jgi:hypothetical protein